MQEKERTKKEKEAAEAKYKFALVDGRKEQARACGRQPECPAAGPASCDCHALPADRQSVAADTALRVGFTWAAFRKHGAAHPAFGRVDLTSAHGPSTAACKP